MAYIDSPMLFVPPRPPVQIVLDAISPVLLVSPAERSRPEDLKYQKI